MNEQQQPTADHLLPQNAAKAPASTGLTTEARAETASSPSLSGAAAPAPQAKPQAETTRHAVADVVGIGAVSWDRFLVVPRFPQPDEKIRAISSAEGAGGMVATALVALARWNLRCRFLGLVGFDDPSHQIVRDLTAEGIDITHLIRHRDCDGRQSTILVDNRNGNRCVVSGPHRLLPLTPGLLADDLFAGARVLHLDTTVDECGIEAVERAKAAGLTVTIDAERLEPRTADLLRKVDYIIAPMRFAETVTGQEKAARAAYALHLQTGRPVIVTDGTNGCDYADAHLAFHQPAFTVPVVDCTGAGDVFHGAFIYGLLAAWDIRQTVRFASWAASAACREIGGRKGIPSLAAVHDFLRADRAD